MQGTITEEMVMWQGDAVCLHSCHLQNHLCHSLLSDPHFLSIPTVTERESRRSEVISFLKGGKGRCSRGMRNVKRDGLWWLLTSTGGLNALPIPVVINYFCGNAEGMITMLFLGASFQTDCGGGTSLRVDKTGLWPKGCLIESES